MQKDGRFWILVGALVIVGGLFLAFLWSVMAAPSEPAGNQVVANVSEPAPTTNAMGDKPGDGTAQPMMGDPTPSFSPDNIIAESRASIDDARREAEERMREARAQIEQAQAEAQRALERSRQQSRQRPRRTVRASKPPEDDKPPEDY